MGDRRHDRINMGRPGVIHAWAMSGVDNHVNATNTLCGKTVALGATRKSGVHDRVTCTECQRGLWAISPTRFPQWAPEQEDAA